MKICSIPTWCFSMVSARGLGFHQRKGGSLSAPKMKAEKTDFSSKNGREEIVSWVAALVFNYCLKKHQFPAESQRLQCLLLAMETVSSAVCSKPALLWSQLDCVLCCQPREQEADTYCSCGAAIHSWGWNLTAQEWSSTLGLPVSGERCCVPCARHVASFQSNCQQRAIQRLVRRCVVKSFSLIPQHMCMFVSSASELSVVQLVDMVTLKSHSLASFQTSQASCAAVLKSSCLA